MADATNLTAITRGAAANLTIEILGLALGYIVQLLLARWMGVAEFGRYSYVTTMAMLLSVPAYLGLNTAILRYVPEYRVAGDWPRATGFLRRCYQLPLLACTLLVGVGCGAAYYGHLQGWEYALPLLIGIWASPLLVLNGLNIHVGRAFGRFTTVKALQDLGRPLLLTALIGSAVLLGLKLNSLLGLALFVTALLALTGMQSVAT